MDGLGQGDGDPVRDHPSRAPHIRANAQDLLIFFNALDTDPRARRALLDRLLGTSGDVVIRPPFQVETGRNLHFGEACFVDHDCHLQDIAEIRIGPFTQIAPGVRILTADPPDTPPRPVIIGRNVWIGPGAVIHPGVRLGNDVIVSAGAVVTASVPEGATVAGTPARVVS